MSSSISSSRKVAWAMWIIASIFYAYQYILRVTPNIMFNEIMNQFSMDTAVFGQFSGIYYIGYSLIHLPIGIMLDRLGPKKVMTACILLTVIGLTPLLFSNNRLYPVIGRLLIGIGSSAAILGVFKIIRMTFSEKLFPKMLSISVTIGLIGAIYGGGPISYLKEVFGYQTVIQLFIATGIFLALITYWIVPEIKYTSKRDVFSDVKEVLGNRNVILCCVFAGLMVGPLEGFADVWGTIFLTNVYGFNETISASISSMIFIGMCFGSPVLTFIAEKVGNYFIAIIGSALLMALSFFLLLVGSLSSSILIVSFILVGIACAYQILSIYKASTFVREEIAGLTTAVVNMIIMIFGYVFHTAIGWLVNIMGGVHSSYALIFGISIIPIALCIGAGGFFLLLIREKQAKASLS